VNRRVESAFIYFEHRSDAFAPKKPVQEKSPLDPQNFVDFKLKAIEPYNHNTAKYEKKSNNMAGNRVFFLIVSLSSDSFSSSQTMRHRCCL
jgi:hypothetical protein